MRERMRKKLATFQSQGNGWRLHSIFQFELHTVVYNLLRGETYIPLPKDLAAKQAIINIKNRDNKCSLLSVLRGLNSKNIHPERVDTDLIQKENTLNMKGIEV